MTLSLTMPTSSLVTVVICTYNRCESLRETLQSLAGQRLANDSTLEVIVVDNNSRDQTSAVVEEAAKTTPWNGRYLFEARQGLSMARNTGIRAARGQVVAFIDDDVVVEPQWAQALWNCVAETGCDAVAGCVKPRWVCPRPAWLSDELCGPIIRQELGDRRIRWTARDRYILGANMAFRKDVFQAIGFFKEELGRRGNALIGGEDLDLHARLMAAGKVIFYEPSAVAHHTVTPERLSPAFYRSWFQDIGYTQAHQLEWKWHYRLSVVPVWRWGKLLQAGVLYLGTQVSGATHEARFRAELWWRFQHSFLRERFDHWRGKPRCRFSTAT
jgi:glycosyltransferase involved in cell wall biosynthesis